MRRFLLAALFAACTPLAGDAGNMPGPALPSRSGDIAGKTLYLTDSFNGAGLIPIDPLSLGDLTAKPLLSIQRAGANNNFASASADGSAVAVMTYGYGQPASATELDISIYDGRTGALRARFSPEVPVIVDGLSADGSRIYARLWPPAALTAERMILDTATGKVVAREPQFSPSGDQVASVKDDPGRRLFTLVAAQNRSGPGPLELGAWDLRTGVQLWHTAIPDLVGGQWSTGRIVAGSPVRAHVAPGLALSPDARFLAIVGAADCCAPVGRVGRLWLVETAGGQVLSARSYKKESSFFERIFAPSVAEAKTPDEADDVSVAFSPDGATLYSWAQRERIDANGDATHEYLGMSSIALGDASVLGSDIKMEPYWYENKISWVRAAPDGSALYALIQRSEGSGSPGYVLRRLDPGTLRVLAERRFDTYRQAFSLRSP